MSRFTRDELHDLLGVPARGRARADGASASAREADAHESGAAQEAQQAEPHASGARASGRFFTPVHAELGKVLPTLWARACVDATHGARARERFVALLRWWTGKHGYALQERVPLGAGDARRLDFVVQAGAVRLALELDARFSAESMQKLQAAQRAGYAVMAVWTSQLASREQARLLRRRVAETLGVRNLHWLPMFHACWGWV